MALSPNATQKHCQTQLKEWRVNECRPMDSPVGRDKEDRLGDGEVVDVQDAQRARRAIARPNYMAMDRPDLRVCSRQLSQRMSSPVTGTVTGIKRVLRYGKNYPRGWTCYAWDNRETLSVFTDSDWAGNKTTRKFTSGGCVMLGSHLISHWSNVALSSGKAELNAAVKGLSELIGFIRVVPLFGR